MIQDTGLGQEMFISAYEKLDKNGDTKLHCYRYTDDPIDALVRFLYSIYIAPEN
jgi:hypothetical protein